MTPGALNQYLDGLIRHQLTVSAMIWGPPGIGKSSIVAQTAAAHDLSCIDLRLSQLAPTDLRGLPVAEGGVARWYPPEFLPRNGRGVLFLDELNLAPPAMQGMAQQLILDRRVGSYAVPEGWYIWAAGNRKEDRAAVFDMPAPLANRFLHLQVEPDLESFKLHALAAGIEEQVIAFLSYRPTLLHKFDPQQPAWPSPRSWAMASKLHGAGLDVAAAVGEAAAVEFHAFILHYGSLPDLARILQGAGSGVPFPDEPSVRYATVVGLTARADDAQKGYHAFRWLAATAATEWVQLYATDLFGLLRTRNQMGALARLIAADPALQRFMDDYQQLLTPQPNRMQDAARP
ncbi:MAG TPA: MoxR family ATPase [Chloroflexota bacterium]|nr:MoxR family ATPase [Chloroflexota bacterium]